MVRFIVVAILLSIYLAINAEINHKPTSPQFHNLEKRAPAKTMPKSARPTRRKNKPKFECNKATYKTVTLSDFVYTHNCFPEGWNAFLTINAVKKVIGEISVALLDEVKNKYEIEPPMSKLFKAFNVKSNLVKGRDGVKVVIIGQDPVPEANQATGLAFSLQPNKDPRESVPTVFNMLVELKVEGMNVDLSNGDLTPWVSQGVLLLNAALTVRQGTSQGMAGSHQGLWRTFTRLLVQHISNKRLQTAWILWGDQAKDLANKWLHNKADHYIKAGGHPSPQGGTAGIRFFGRNYFSCANDFLNNKGRGRVDWGLPSRHGLFSGKKPGDCDVSGLYDSNDDSNDKLFLPSFLNDSYISHEQN
ncbi:uracil-DNA glycosylase-like [Oculina patagonica]